MSRWLVRSHPCNGIRREVAEIPEPIRSEYRSDKEVTDVPMGGLEETEVCELCENPVDGIIRGGQNLEC
jgi:hypothetical protein